MGMVLWLDTGMHQIMKQVAFILNWRGSALRELNIPWNQAEYTTR